MKEKKKTRNIKSGKRVRTLIIIDILLLIAVIGIFSLTLVMRDFVLIGDEEMSVEINTEFVDPGVESKYAKTSGEVDTSVIGDYTISYSLLGRKLTRTVHVTEPSGSVVIGLRGSAVQIVRQGDPYIENGAFATDVTSVEDGGALDENLIKISGKADTDVPGDYEISYDLEHGNSTYSVKRTVRVVTANDFGEESGTLPVLMYHWVYSDEDRPDNINGNWILDTDLEEQLRYLKDKEYYYPGWKEFRAWLDGKISLPNRSVILTFDDGRKGFFEYGKPLLEKYEIPATAFLICWEKNKGMEKVVKYASPYLDFENNSYAMHQAGYVSGYRGIIAAMSKDEILEDLRKAQEIIGNNEALAYPYGDYTDAAIEAVKEQGMQCAFTTSYGRVTRGMNPYKLPRVRVSGNADFRIWRDSISK